MDGELLQSPAFLFQILWISNPKKTSKKYQFWLIRSSDVGVLHCNMV